MHPREEQNGACACQCPAVTAPSLHWLSKEGYFCKRIQVSFKVAAAQSSVLPPRVPALNSGPEPRAGHQAILLTPDSPCGTLFPYSTNILSLKRGGYAYPDWCCFRSLANSEAPFLRKKFSRSLSLCLHHCLFLLHVVVCDAPS